MFVRYLLRYFSAISFARRFAHLHNVGLAHATSAANWSAGSSVRARSDTSASTARVLSSPLAVAAPRALAPANAGDPHKGAPLAVEAARLAGVDLQLSADLEHDLRHAAVFVYVTHSEGLGSAVLLAMSAGVPVVASKVGGLNEVIRHGENGLLVENEPPAIAAAIRELLDHPSQARKMGSAARRTVIERFTVERMVHRTIEVYRQVLT